MKLKWRAAPSSSHLILSFDPLKPWQRTPDLITGACTWWSNYCQVSGQLVFPLRRTLKGVNFSGAGWWADLGKAGVECCVFLQIWTFSGSLWFLIARAYFCSYLQVSTPLPSLAWIKISKCKMSSGGTCTQHIHPKPLVLKGRLQTDNTRTLFQQPPPAQKSTSLQEAMVIS